jgi:uncharacterized membrane protein
MKPREFLNRIQHAEIVAAIQAAEAKTSGEIRVCISHHVIDDPIDAAKREFAHLGMSATKARNGVLIYVAPRTRRFAIIGDEGVHSHCGEVFWREVADAMSARFRRGDYTEGIVHGIRTAGELLARHFPPSGEDRNELSDGIAGD